MDIVTVLRDLLNVLIEFGPIEQFSLDLNCNSGQLTAYLLEACLYTLESALKK